MYRRLILFAMVMTGRAIARQPMTIDQLVIRHEQALGGINRIHALDSLVIRGMYHEGGPIPPDMPVVARNYNAFKRPFYQVIGDPANPNPDLRKGSDGSSWDTAEFLQDSLVDYKEKGTSLDLQGTERIGDRDCYRIFVTLSDGFEKFLFVDQERF
jgi:hypothetical protein